MLLKEPGKASNKRLRIAARRLQEHHGSAIPSCYLSMGAFTGDGKGNKGKSKPYVVCAAFSRRGLDACSFGGWIYNDRRKLHPKCRCGSEWAGKPGKGTSGPPNARGNAAKAADANKCAPEQPLAIEDGEAEVKAKDALRDALEKGDTAKAELVKMLCPQAARQVEEEKAAESNKEKEGQQTLGEGKNRNWALELIKATGKVDKLTKRMDLELANIVEQQDKLKAAQERAQSLVLDLEAAKEKEDLCRVEIAKARSLGKTDAADLRDLDAALPTVVEGLQSDKDITEALGLFRNVRKQLVDTYAALQKLASAKRAEATPAAEEAGAQGGEGGKEDTTMADADGVVPPGPPGETEKEAEENAKKEVETRKRAALAEAQVQADSAKKAKAEKVQDDQRLG